MKRIMLFMMLMLGTVSAVMAQGADVPATDYDAMIGTFAGFGRRMVVVLTGRVERFVPQHERLGDAAGELVCGLGVRDATVVLDAGL